jgi:hypothetical protein
VVEVVGLAVVELVDSVQIYLVKLLAAVLQQNQL